MTSLGNRVVTSTLTAHLVVGKVLGGGFLQGGVLSLLMWCLFEDGLLLELNRTRIKADGYVDDIVILVKGSFEVVLVQRVFMVTVRWCGDRTLSI